MRSRRQRLWQVRPISVSGGPSGAGAPLISSHAPSCLSLACSSHSRRSPRWSSSSRRAAVCTTSRPGRAPTSARGRCVTVRVLRGRREKHTTPAFAPLRQAAPCQTHPLLCDPRSAAQGGYKLENGRLTAFPRAKTPPIMLVSDLDGTMVRPLHRRSSSAAPQHVAAPQRMCH